MRIPVNSCPDCDKGRKFTDTGHHFPSKENAGHYTRCPFVDAELAGSIGNGAELLAVKRSRRSAMRVAREKNGGLLWCGQAPVEFWLVLSLMHKNRAQ